MSNVCRQQICVKLYTAKVFVLLQLSSELLLSLRFDRFRASPFAGLLLAPRKRLVSERRGR